MLLMKNQQVELTVDNLDSQGRGVARHDGLVIFVPGALAGERVLAQIIKVSRSFSVAKMLDVLEPSSGRVEAPCPYFGKCGGCDLQHLDYPAQMSVMRTQVQGALERLGGFSDIHVEETIPSPKPYRYRNKAQFPVGGGPVIGFYRARSHDIIDMHDCLLQPEFTQAFLQAVRTYMHECGVSAYNEQTGAGLLRHVGFRSNEKGEALVTLVVNGAELPGEERLVSIIRQNVPQAVGIVLNENTRRDNVILGDKSRVIWGEDAILETLCGKSYKVSPQSFFQVNTPQAEKLYEIVRRYADMDGTGTLLDVYCGTGTIGLSMAGDCERLIGVESVPQAVLDAKENAEANGVAHAEFIPGRAEDVLMQMARDGFKADVAVLDPPRKGCDERLLSAVAACGPQKIIYVSCDAATLARDAKILGESGYAIGKVQPVDLFPQTNHVECVTLMSRVE
ncbi:MAG: 23S rRNA (uracil(1939)-C(5))-methyltransferase RlmD, partial [Christensenellales bacterium]